MQAIQRVSISPPCEFFRVITKHDSLFAIEKVRKSLGKTLAGVYNFSVTILGDKHKPDTREIVFNFMNFNFVVHSSIKQRYLNLLVDQLSSMKKPAPVQRVYRGSWDGWEDWAKERDFERLVNHLESSHVLVYSYHAGNHKEVDPIPRIDT